MKNSIQGLFKKLSKVKKYSKRWFMLVILILVALGFGNIPGDTSTINANVKVKWTAPGDDLIVGQATVSDLRYSGSQDSLVNFWDSTAQISTQPPSSAGFKDSVTVNLNLELGKDYFFAIKHADEVPNWSGISNIFVLNIPDSLAPSPVTDLTVEVVNIN